MPNKEREMLHVEPAKTCIYCGLSRPFSDEHVFPAGLGGDDRRFLLKDLVCGVCNSGVFSKLETKFMRASPVAMARLYLQPTGRGKGKKASIPSINTNSTFVFLEPHGAVEAEMTAGGKLITLLQLLFLEDDKVALTGGDHMGVDVFLDALTAALGSQVQVVEKIKDIVPSRFVVETFEWDGARYQSVSRETTPTLPQKRLWREPLASPPAAAATARAPTLYQRSDGQLSLRVPPSTQAGPMLTRVRKAPLAFGKEEDVPYSDFANPSVQVSMTIDMNDYARVLAKIGVNFVAHAYKEQYARHHAFNRVKTAILKGQAAIWLQTIPKQADALRGVPSTRHVAMLHFTKSRAGRFHAGMIIRLYGGTTQYVHLSANALQPPDGLAILVIDYENHKIEPFFDWGRFSAVYPQNAFSDFKKLDELLLDD
ncbi:hypothetical protein [Paraburkholderia graminis]|uniref:hypothetical protein n=1 Tax=Paraburkholderia graminis TaxID=60548 RepID=UPI00278F062C|nr:hypothetical protein [Paraburkholderia graminis]MDQ0621016.1 hypothetical protein [Paraburkholderia graminis]